MTSINKIAILVISCDKYSDLWEPCVQMFNKYWPDCPYDKYIATNTIKFNYQGFTNIQIGEDKSWSYGLKCVLNQLEEQYEYVFTLLEDYYFIEKIDNDYMIKMFNSFILAEGNFLSLYKLPSRLNHYNEFFGELENNIPYRQSCVFTLWNIKTLKEILNDNENAWEFEKIGVKRGFQYDKFFGTYYNFKTINVVIRGKLVPKDYGILKKLLPEVNITRPMFTSAEICKMNIRDFFIHSFLNFIPKKIRSTIYFAKSNS